MSRFCFRARSTALFNVSFCSPEGASCAFITSSFAPSTRSNSDAEILAGGNHCLALLSVVEFISAPLLLATVPPRCSWPADLFNAGVNQQNHLFSNGAPLGRNCHQSHHQHNAKLCVAAHHAGICCGSFFERIGFNHCAYPA